MADASTSQLVLAAVSGGLAGQVLAVLTRRVEFRREDRARWIRERRESYAAYLDEIGGMLGESAPLAPYFQTQSRLAGSDPGSEAFRATVKEIATTAYNRWAASLEHREVLRLLASKQGLGALDRLDAVLNPLVKALIATQVSGVGSKDEIDRLRAAAQAEVERLTDIARKDIGA